MRPRRSTRPSRASGSTFPRGRSSSTEQRAPFATRSPSLWRYQTMNDVTGMTGGSLQAAAEELRGLSVPRVETEQLDVTEIGALEDFADSAVQRLGDIDLVLIAAGELDMADLSTLDASRG